MLSVFSNKKVLVTGHTGFKGSWLSAWLLELGADVLGLSVDIPSNPSHFEVIELDKRILHIVGDVRDANTCISIIKEHQPDFVFHLAAQPLVRQSYTDPAYTFETNMLGTLNILEGLRLSNHACNAVFITSDKCYDNVEQIWGYREDDKLGGKDPYSGSKGVAELIIRSYAASFFQKEDSKVKVAVGRAGNVIGGGDWADDRIVPDIVRAWSENKIVNVRNKQSTRPWQHVLEPLSGYLVLAANLSENSKLNGEAFNFGPDSDQNFSVEKLLENFQSFLPGLRWEEEIHLAKTYEATLLKLCCDKALHLINWRPSLSFSENVSMTAVWYSEFYSSNGDMKDITINQINNYMQKARMKGNSWL